MITIRNLKEELQGLKDLETLVNTYQEIAATRMRRVKSSVLRNREYESGLNDIFQQVRFFYKKRRHKGALRGNGKTVAILFSSNTMLYGSIIEQTFSQFAEYISNNITDAVIVGKIGQKLYKVYTDAERARPAKQRQTTTEADNIDRKRARPSDSPAATAKTEGQALFTPFPKIEPQYFDLSDSGADKSNLKKIVEYVLQYEKIVVYHGKFKNILTQEPSQTLISEELLGEKVAESAYSYIFEPSIEEVLAFFESRILASVFEQSFHESNLSKFASRMIALDYASENINKRIELSELKRREMKHRIEGAKQMTQLSGFRLWSKNV
ncbi:F0F1 ATP synthase subunit gamma [candidate division WWE3 bacterium]|nr:F0F1 ATP synthase subunit gamma [candidate division WWE3 bacterium]